MSPTSFPQQNTVFGPPPGYDVSQIQPIPAFVGEYKEGGMDGARVVIVAWKPDAEDLVRLNNGQPVFLGMVGGLSPHWVSTAFPNT